MLLSQVANKHTISILSLLHPEQSLVDMLLVSGLPKIAVHM